MRVGLLVCEEHDAEDEGKDGAKDQEERPRFISVHLVIENLSNCQSLVTGKLECWGLPKSRGN